MYDELSRIESIYGCVAEYNRCMEEKRNNEVDYDWLFNNDYDPSDYETTE